MGAVRAIAGVTVLGANDDGSVGPVPLGFPFHFTPGGTTYTTCFVNNNGGVGFAFGSGDYTPNSIQDVGPALLPFFSDVDTRGAGSQPVRYGIGIADGQPAFICNWIDVGYYGSHTDKLNIFQLIIYEDNHVEFNYDRILWETGDASSGSNGFGGVAARAGWFDGTTAFELPGSGGVGALLDSNGTTGLVHNSQGSLVSGRYIFYLGGSTPTVAAYPDLKVEIAFDSTPFATPVWTDVTEDFRVGSIKRGRNRELDRMAMGTCALVLDNRERQYDPAHDGGPHAGEVRPMKRLRVRAEHGGVTYPLFSGFIDSWDQQYAPPWEATVTVTASDAFKVLQQKTIVEETWGPTRSGTRIIQLLDAAGWPSADRTIDTGVAVLQSTTTEDEQDTHVSLLEAIQKIEVSEGGVFFAKADGTLRFTNRHASLNKSVMGTFGDDVAVDTEELGYTSISFDYGDALIRNRIVVARVGGIGQVAEDAASQDEYLEQSYFQSDLLFIGDAESADRAAFLLAVYANPFQRVTSLTIDPSGDPERLWAQALGRELGGLLTVNRRPQGIGAVYSQDVRLEGITHSFGPMQWQTTFQLSPLLASADGSQVVWLQLNSNTPEFPIPTPLGSSRLAT